MNTRKLSPVLLVKSPVCGGGLLAIGDAAQVAHAPGLMAECKVAPLPASCLL